MWIYVTFLSIFLLDLILGAEGTGMFSRAMRKGLRWLGSGAATSPNSCPCPCWSQPSKTSSSHDYWSCPDGWRGLGTCHSPRPGKSVALKFAALPDMNIAMASKACCTTFGTNIETLTFWTITDTGPIISTCSAKCRTALDLLVLLDLLYFFCLSCP